MGPNGSGKSTFAYALMGHPAYEITEGDIRFDGESVARDGGRRAGAARPVPRVPVPARDPRRHGHELPPQRDQREAQGGERRRGGPGPGQGVPDGAARGDGAPQGAAGARAALPERRVLGRREEARRDPADGDAEAADRDPRRDRLRARHRRAADRRRRCEHARRPRHGRTRDHALPADPQLRHARTSCTSSSTGGSSLRAAPELAHKLEAEGYEAFIPAGVAIDAGETT